MKKGMLILLCAALVLCAVGCTAAAGLKETVNRAMYVTFGETGYVMVDENGSVYTVTMPNEIVNLAGERIAPEDLVRGNILEIRGNGVMAESYPGQYPGVTSIRVVEEGTPEDADRYQSIIDEIYSEPTPSQPPALHLEYTVPQASAYAQATMGSYQWSYELKDGQGSATIACGSPVLSWPKIYNLNLTEKTAVTLRFEKQPDSIAVTRWPAAERGAQEGEASLGESVKLTQTDDGYLMEAEPGYVYGVTTQWPNGSVEYGFMSESES